MLTPEEEHDLIARAREAHQNIGRLHREILQHARTAGQALARLKEQKVSEGPGVWPAWVQPNVGMTRRHAENYIRIAERWDWLAPHLEANPDMTLADALAMLSAAFSTRRPPTPRTPPRDEQAPPHEGRPATPHHDEPDEEPQDEGEEDLNEDVPLPVLGRWIPDTVDDVIEWITTLDNDDFLRVARAVIEEGRRRE